MAKRYGFPLGIVAIAVLLLGVALHASGAMMFFSIRNDFQSQLIGGFDVINFNSFQADTDFPIGINNAINFGSFSLSQTSPAIPGSIFDVSDFRRFGDDAALMDADIDDTPYANIFLNGSSSVDFVFSTPVLGFGADFRGFTGAINYTVFPVGRGTSVSRTIDFQNSFVGVISADPTDPIGRIQFQYNGTSGGSANLALDNVTVSSVPEPASLLLWGIGATLLMGYGYVRWHNREPIQAAPEKNA